MSTMPPHWADRKKGYRSLWPLVKHECANCVASKCIMAFIAKPGYKGGTVVMRAPAGGGAHGYASMNCPHWLAGWCKREGLPDNPKERADCPLNGWEPGSDRCGWFEEHLLPDAPAGVQEDYAWRVSEPPSDLIATEGKCVMFHETPHRCPYFEKSLLPIVPRAVAAEYVAITNSTEGVERLHEADDQWSDRQCPGLTDEGCGAPLRKRKRLCDDCAEASRKASRRRRQAKWRSNAV